MKKASREECHRDLDAMAACCKATGLSLLMVRFDGQELELYEVLIGNRDTLELLVGEWAGVGGWCILEGEPVSAIEEVPLSQLSQH
jgi:hypothetical protein